MSGRVRRLAFPRGQAGQAAVELVALTPILCALAVALGAALLTGAAGIAAEHAVGRGVAAGATGADPVRAARAGLPRALARHASVRVRVGELEVVVDMPGPVPAQRARLPLVPQPRGGGAMSPGERGQVTIALVAALAVAAAVAVVLLTLVEVARERARAQSAADGAALAAARVLTGRVDGERAARAAAGAYAARAGVEVERLLVVGLAVEVGVRRHALRVPVPALAGGGVVRVAPRALARAALAGGLPAGADPLAADGLPVDVPSAYRLALLAAAERERLPVTLLAAQLRAESGFRPTAVSSAGAQGIAQFMPGTWAGSWNPWRGESPFDPMAAIPAQARFMRRLLDAAGGDVGRALAFYNAGQGGAAGPPTSWPDETRAYVAAVLARAGLGGEGALSAVLPVGPPILRLIG